MKYKSKRVKRAQSKRVKRAQSKRVKARKRKTMKGGSIFPYILQDTFWNASDSIRDTYNNLAGNYPGVSSSITVQGQIK